ncbi:hypothetical protein ILYODFUR_019311 [Ilyodon furcidens]|uniref:Uncharacterized protein n=1 Tax=Ilyodon furcidens TaxID=33524 RepID=A0ABV0TAS0_9TELE
MTHKYPLSAAPTVLKRAQLRVSSFYVNISVSERDPRRRERSLNDEEEGGVAFTDVRPSAARYKEVCGSLSLSLFQPLYLLGEENPRDTFGCNHVTSPVPCHESII